MAARAAVEALLRERKLDRTLTSSLPERLGEDAVAPFGIEALDRVLSGLEGRKSYAAGLPRGQVSEVVGPASSGRTSLMYSMLAYATAHEETCALVDTNDVFAPTIATDAGIDFDRLLWVRCAANLEHAFKATDLLLHAGGFGLVILDLGDVAGKDARRIISSWWYRFRRTVEDRPTVLAVISEEACTRSCAALTLELKGAPEWSGNLLRQNAIKVNRQRPISPWLHESQFRAIA